MKMNKLLFFAAIVIAFAFTSCKKDLTCSCTSTTTSTEPGYTSSTTSNTTDWTKVKKSDAAIYCSSDTYSYQSTYYDITTNTNIQSTVTTTTICELKK